MSTTPETPDKSSHNAYQVAPEKPGDEQGYRTADPRNADEGYTAENVLKRHGEEAPWGRPTRGDEDDAAEK